MPNLGRRIASFERKASDCPVHGSRYTGIVSRFETKLEARGEEEELLSSAIVHEGSKVGNPARTGAIPMYNVAFLIVESQSRYLVHNYENGALLRIEPVRPVRDNTMYECLAENGVGDAVSAEAQLRVYEGTCPFFFFLFFISLSRRLKIFINDYSGETWKGRRWTPLFGSEYSGRGGNLIFNESGGMVGNRWRWWCWRATHDRPKVSTRWREEFARRAWKRRADREGKR